MLLLKELIKKGVIGKEQAISLEKKIKESNESEEEVILKEDVV